MSYSFEVRSQLEAGRQVASNLPNNTLDSDRRLYALLVTLAFDTVEEKQYAVVPQFVTFHSSLTCIAAVLGVSRWTVWRSLARLKSLGAVDSRVQKGKLFDNVRNTGTVIQVKLNPGAGSAAKLSYQDLKHEYKDLNRLARYKRLSHQLVLRIQELQDQTTKYLLLKEWTLKPYTHKNPVDNFMVHGGLEALLAVPHARGKEVHKSIDSGARMLSEALADSRSLDMYRKLLWRLKSRLNAGEGDEFHILHTQVLRIIRADVPEWQGLRSPGALLVSRLKRYQWWTDCMVV